jgi:heme-degrading monooxygenase HmoA
MNKEFKPYYAVIFTSTLSKNNQSYNEMAEKMEALAKTQEGYLGFDSARSQLGISISYWKSLDDIKNWKKNSDHLVAQQKGRDTWYSWYHVRICKVEREYEFDLS